jgi:hypothetical protein
MATYYKYAERSAEDYVDWGAIGKTMSDTLLKEQENRDKMKADIDKASREFGETLMNSPQGEHRGMNKWALEYANNAQQFQLMQLRNLKAGKLSLKDYLVSRENLKQGTNDAFDIMKKYNDKYGEYMERQKPDGDGSGLEAFLLGEVEGFGNLTASSLYINPADGQVSAGMRVPRDPSKPYDPETNPYTAKMSNNPSDYRTLNSLNFALSAQIDKYDAAGAVNTIVDSFATDYQILTRGSRGKLTTVNSVTQMGKDGKLFTDALETKIVAYFESNPYHALSTLQDYLVNGPDGEKIELTRNPDEVNDHTLLLKANSEQPDGGMPQADFTSETGKKLLKYMKDKMAEQVLAGLNRKVSATAGFAPPSSGGPTPRDTKTQEENNAFKYFDLRVQQLRNPLKKLSDEEIAARKTKLNPTGGPTAKELAVLAREYGVDFREETTVGTIGTEEEKKVRRPRYFIDGKEYETSLTIPELADIVESKIRKDNIITAYKRKQVRQGELDN